ncbi:hypothetical protein O0L34_g13107 [Tuta absoluta]|nr:hypothetical protein O0L34_g13107 [Tuta absoluta]
METENKTLSQLQLQPQTDQTSVKVGVMPETMRLISRVFQRCEEEGQMKLDINFKDPIQRAVSYTGLHKNVITEVLKNVESDLKMDGQFSEVEIEEIDRNVIQRALMNFYFNEDVLPTTKQLYNEVQKQLPMYVDIRMFRKELLKMNYTWKKIPNQTLVVIETPTSTFERYHYLKRIIEHRKENRPIVFVDISYTNGENEFKVLEDPNDFKCDEEGNEYFMYAVSKDQVYALEAAKNTAFTKQVFENWIQETLCLHIPPKSVVIMNNLGYNSEEIRTLPTENSLKFEMIEWLEFHDIPCRESMSKMELFSLVEKYTNSIDKLYKIDKMFKVYNHDVLRIPNSIKKLTPATFVRDLVKTNFESSTHISKNEFVTFKSIMEEVNHVYLEQYDEYIANTEITIFETDKRLDEKMDRMCINMEGLLAYDAKADSDVPTLSDSD